MTERLERVPDRWLPLAYLLFAHLSLLTACLAFVLAPTSLAGFFYHPKMIAVVHLVTLGWITGSILGVLHLILPLALRSPLPARGPDRWAFWCFVVGVLGMVSHFWIDTTGGMVWSAGMVIAAIFRVGWRVLAALRRAPIPLEHRLPFFLAFFNLILAGLLGLLIGIDKSTDVLPGFTLDHVAAHAHLAALGWATLMVMGSAYRLLPMVLPSALPRGGRLIVAVLTTELGVLGIGAALFAGSSMLPVAALVLVAGTLVFLDQVRWMLAHPKPPPRQRRHPDLAHAHLAAAFVYLTIAVGLGSAIVLRPQSPYRMQLLMAYGVTLLVGFLSQMVVGISVRILPLFTWMRDFAAGGFDQVPLSPHRRTARSLHQLTFWSWTLGTPLLTLGLALNRALSIRLGGALLAIAVAASLSQIAHQLRSAAAPLGDREPASRGVLRAEP